MKGFTRRQFVSSSIALAATSVASRALGEDLPEVLTDLQNQYNNYLKSLVNSPNVKDNLIVINNTITPFDLNPETPYFNQHIFRMYADQTYSSPTAEFKAPSAMNQSARFSSLYKDTISIAASQVDQNHPDIAQVVLDLQSKRGDAQKLLNEKNKEFDDQWRQIVKDRNLQEGTSEYDLNYLKWLEDVRYADQISDYSTEVDRLNSQIRAVRRSKYTPSENALLDNMDSLSDTFNIARPRYPQTEIDAKRRNQELTDITLADPRQTPAAIFDVSPLILPVSDLGAFLSNAGGRAFDSTTESRQVNSGSASWNASGGASFFGWSVGGGSSGSSSYSNDMRKLKSLKIGFKNIQEIYIDRGQWFNPGVLQDSKTIELVETLSQIQYLRFVGVSLFIGRGLSLSLELSDNTIDSNWSEQSIRAQGGASLFGFKFGGSGGRSQSSSNFTSTANGSTITFADGDNVCRVLGARVEPFLTIAQPAADLKPNLAKFSDLINGNKSYLQFQSDRLKGLVD